MNFSEALDRKCYLCEQKAAFHRMSNSDLFCLEPRGSAHKEEWRWWAAVEVNPMVVYLMPTKWMQRGSFGNEYPTVYRQIMIGLNEWKVDPLEGEQQSLFG